MTADTSHLVALYTRLIHEREYLAQEQTDAGRALRNVWIKQIKSEIAGEEKFLGIGDRLEWVSAQLDTLREVAEALQMVRDADDDCRRDGLQTIPPMPRAKIDRALAQYTQERIKADDTPERIFPAAPGSLPMSLADMGAKFNK